MSEVRVGHLMEASLYITETENKMFETLIGLDFKNAVRLHEGDEAENTDSASDDAKKEKVSGNIKDKLSALVAKVKAAISNAFRAIVDKILQLIKADKKIIDRYNGVISEKNLEGFPGLNKFAMPHIDKLPDVSDILGNVYDMLESDSNEGFKDEEAKDRVISTANSTIKACLPEVQDTYKPETNQLAKDCIEAMKTLKENSDLLKNLRSQKWDARIERFKDKFRSRDKNDEQANKEFEMMSTAMKLTVKVCNIYITGCSQIFSRCRKLVLTAGAYAAKKANGTLPAGKTKEEKEEAKVQEESFIFAVAEASDMYMERVFEY